MRIDLSDDEVRLVCFALGFYAADGRDFDGTPHMKAAAAIIEKINAAQANAPRGPQGFIGPAAEACTKCDHMAAVHRGSSCLRCEADWMECKREPNQVCHGFVGSGTGLHFDGVK